MTKIRKMKLYQKLGLLAGFSLLGYSMNGQEVAKHTDAVSAIPMALETSCGSVAGQFTNNNVADYIIAAKKPGYDQADLYLFVGKGDGTFPKYGIIGSIPMALETGVSLTAADFDGDGDLDVLATSKLPQSIIDNTTPESKRGKSYIFFNKGGANFSLKND